MAFPVRHVAYEPADQLPAPRRYAWSVFAILFALMVVDYIDRQVVVSMFPHLKAQWDLSDSQLGGARLDRLDHRRDRRGSAVAARRPVEPREEHLPHGARLEPRDDLVRVRERATGICWARAASVGLGEAAYGTVGAALLASLFPPRMRSTVLGAFLAAAMIGSVLGVMLGGFIAERWGWQAGFGAVGIPGLVLCVVFLLVVRDYKTVRAAVARTDTASTHRLSARAVVAELLRPRTALVTCIGAGLNLLVVSTI